MGLSFSVNRGVNIPQSLRNIFKCLEGCNLQQKFVTPKHGDLTKWAQQGVLLLNAGLTVEKGVPNAHKHLKWAVLTNQIIELVSSLNPKVVFMLWGSDAIRKKELVDQSRHLVIRTTHPSPMSAYRLDLKTQKNFFDSKCFQEAEKWMVDSGVQPVDWTLDG